MKKDPIPPLNRTHFNETSELLGTRILLDKGLRSGHGIIWQTLANHEKAIFIQHPFAIKKLIEMLQSNTKLYNAQQHGCKMVCFSFWLEGALLI